jgi:hypothetical protein
MNVQLKDIVESTYCRYDLYSECVRGDDDTLTCAKCIADSAAEIVRT